MMTGWAQQWIEFLQGSDTKSVGFTRISLHRTREDIALFVTHLKTGAGYINYNDLLLNGLPFLVRVDDPALVPQVHALNGIWLSSGSKQYTIIGRATEPKALDSAETLRRVQHYQQVSRR